MTPRSVIAGIDIGNSTTEVVLADGGPDGSDVIGAGRAPTRRAKGSPESVDGAVVLVRRLERQYGVRIDRAAVARLRPAHTMTTTLPEPEEVTGRLSVAAAGAGTAGGGGFGVGRPLLLTGPSTAAPDDGDDIVAVVPSGMGYRAALECLEELASAGRLAAVVLEDDEAVLLANRLSVRVPVVDEVAATAVRHARRIAVEVVAPGMSMRHLTDPLRLVAVLGLGEDERSDAARVASRVQDTSNAVVVLDDQVDRPASPAQVAGRVEFRSGQQLPLSQAYAQIAAGPVGLSAAYSLPADPGFHPVTDLWTVDLSAVTAAVVARRGAPGTRAAGLAVLGTAPLVDPSAALTDRLEVPVTADDEGRAAWTGAMSTPGAGPGVVIDLGGGTIDTVSPSSSVTAAGAGELLTASVAALTDTTRATAEWTKRGPAFRVESPQVLLGEDGSRTFLARPAPADATGALVVRGPAGLLAFSRTLAPGEWRALRVRLKVDTLGANVARALRTLGVAPTTFVVVGGPAGDEEVLAAVAHALPDGVAVGRGDVAGSLGHRYAVAYGLTLSDAR